MIFTLILQFTALVFSGFQLVLSGGANVNSNILDAITYITAAINSFSYLIPAGALLLSISIVVGFEFTLWTFRGLVWIYRHIPFIGH